jgi:chromosome segregation ATPase
MKVLLLFVFLWGILAPGLPLRGQATPGPETPASPPVAPIAGQQGDDTDRFGALLEEVDHQHAAFEKLQAQNMAEVARLLRTRRCQISRIGGDLDRTITAMNNYLDAEKKYWQTWNDAEEKRVEGQRTTLASMETDKERTATLIDKEKEGREDLERRKKDLEQSPRTQQIIKEIDDLVLDITESEKRLAEAQKYFDSLTEQIKNMKTSIEARLIGIRQSLYRLEAWRLQTTAYYEKQRAAAQEVCNTKQPGAPRQPLSTPGSNPQ